MTTTTVHAKFRPLLAAPIETEEDLTKLKFPLIASPKVDGIRVLIHPELGPVTRSLKSVRSRLVYGALKHPDNIFLDGEVTAGLRSASNVFNRTTQCVMAEDGADDFTYWVFDYWVQPDRPYLNRWMERTADFRAPDENMWMLDERVRILPWTMVESPEDILQAEEEYLAEGFEGIMLRDPNKGYKFNRSTVKEQTLLKLKRYIDAEAIIVGVEPRLRNHNPQERDAFGLAKRSSHQAGQVVDDACGRLVVQDCSGRFGQFSIGSGFDEAQRIEIWGRRDDVIGSRINYKYQEVGVVDAPRFPIFRGFRPAE